MIPFNNHLEADQRDLGLKDRLTAPESLSGILNWCIEGLRRFREEGMRPSGLSMLATMNYQAESDKIHAFMGDCLVSAEDECVTGARLCKAYQDWCKDSGYQAEGKQAFFRDLRERKLMVGTCTVKGVTRRNVVPNCKLAGSVYD